MLEDLARDRLAEAVQPVMRRQLQLDPKVARTVLAEFQCLASEVVPNRGVRSDPEEEP